MYNIIQYFTKKKIPQEKKNDLRKEWEHFLLFAKNAVFMRFAVFRKCLISYKTEGSNP